MPSTAPRPARLFPIPTQGSAEVMARVLSTVIWTAWSPSLLSSTARGSLGQRCTLLGWHHLPACSQGWRTLGEATVPARLPQTGWKRKLGQMEERRRASWLYQNSIRSEVKPEMLGKVCIYRLHNYLVIFLWSPRLHLCRNLNPVIPRTENHPKHTPPLFVLEETLFHPWHWNTCALFPAWQRRPQGLWVGCR